MAVRSRFQQLRSKWSRTFPPNLARLMLLTCAALWGGSYLIAKFAMVAIPPQWLMGIRVLGACTCMMLLFHRVILPALTPKILVPALVVGVTYWGTMVTQTIGLQTIDPGRSAFLTAAYCVLTPFASWLVAKTRPGMINLVAAVICLVGVGFVSLKSGGSLALSTGDWLTIATSVIFAFNLTFLGVYAKRFHPIALTWVQFFVAGVLFIAGALFTEPMPNGAWLQPSVVAAFLYLFLGATMTAQIMQNIGLAHVPPAQASIIMCTESLFAVVFSAMFWGEAITWNSIVGFSLIFAAVLLSIIRKRKN
ncbi:DMT family transporter [Bifidobacterium vespertilionis]|uniref:DMT family transporter n=1 Tax=Bifidobacterium vespertilionis TaxID=2562524 RepID=A0A5J5DWH8_9BIFI|nr:DMT family transporter [Bifidobacterium vespertilionis]KAA8821275.1 DMT family transporter [Bifidobacterium vespertilionis]KAA8822514.1 DMT family transporter [Bifidobacterium vespertilionis]